MTWSQRAAEGHQEARGVGYKKDYIIYDAEQLQLIVKLRKTNDEKDEEKK